MTFSSKPLPLEFWTRLEARLAADYQVQRANLMEALAPLPVTVDTGTLVLAQAQQARDQVFGHVRDLDSMQMLLMVLAGQLRIASFRAEIPDVEAHIRCLRNVAEMYTSTLIGLPRRLPREQEVVAALTEYNALRNLGTGEITMQERQRLRAMTIQLPVLGAEDTVEHARALRTLQSQIDQLDAELQNLKVSTLMSLRVPNELARLVEAFGVQMMADAPPPAPVLPSPPARAGDPALPSE